jgi:hypothetical protein
MRDASREAQFARETEYAIKSTETGLGAHEFVFGCPDPSDGENRLRDASRVANTADYGGGDDGAWDFSEIEGVRLLSRGFSRDGQRVFQFAVGSGRSRVWFGSRIYINGGNSDDDRYADAIERAERESDTQRRQRETARAARAALGYDAT